MQANGVIVDYGMGNLLSVKKKFDRIGCDVTISNDPLVILDAPFLILPGVGHFQAGVRNLKEFGLWDVLNTVVLNDRKPILGICLGLQLMCQHSEEGDVEGFGWLDAEVKRFKVCDRIRYKVPHVGWNYLEGADHPLFKSIDTSKKPFYFIHSYYVSSKKTDQVLARTTYESGFDVALSTGGNIYGLQFHPEKSHSQGEDLIKNFVHLVSRV